MDSARWERIQTIFHEAAARPESERQPFLEAICGGDAELAGEVSAMLQADQSAASVLDRGLSEAAGRILGAPLDSASPREFGPYRLQRILGEGGMGIVWLAERADTGNVVAVKFLPHAGLSPARRERFGREIRTLGKLKHPYIARLYDAGTLSDGTPWFVMEYVDGLPLLEYCRREEQPIEERLRLFRKVCEAVQYAHGQAILHRDLKPSNILVERDGAPRLLDFGVARELQATDENPELTRPGLRFLSPDYAAPEWIRDGTVGLYTDVYSLGVILYEMLAGSRPADREHPEKPSVAMRNSGRGKAASGDLDLLCLEALHHDPQGRYSSVEALIRDLDHYLEKEPLEARPESVRYRAGKFIARNRPAIFASGLVAVLVIGLIAFFTLRLAKARNAALAEAARTQRVERFMENLFEGGDKDAGPADDLRVVTLVDRGLQEAQGLDADPAAQAELYETLGTIYRKLGKFDRADSVLQAALERRRLLAHVDETAIAGSLLELGVLRADQARLPEAEDLIRQALAIDLRRLPPGHPAIARATVALGKVLGERGQYEQAIEALGQAQRIEAAQGGASGELAETLESLADANFYLGHYAASDSLNRQALEILERLRGPRHPSLADVLVNLGNVRIQLGHYPEAEAYFRRALAINESWYGKDHPLTARTENYVAQALNWQSRYDDSRSLLQHSLAATERAYGKSHPRVALVLSNLGFVAVELGTLKEAEEYFTRMAEIYRSSYGNQHQYTALALANLASVYMKEEQYSRAEEVFREVIRIYALALPAGHLNTAIAEIKLGRALIGQKRFREAEEHTLAGHEILNRQANPSNDYLQGARADLGKIYDALGEADKAAKFRAEVAANQPGKPATSPSRSGR
jgi:serine/threonine-protein kinase